jgi:hypothetical protein
MNGSGAALLLGGDVAMKKQDEFPAPELPEDPEARRELARQFVGLITIYAEDQERACRAIHEALQPLRELLD